MLSELLINCSSSRQAAVLLHLTTSDAREEEMQGREEAACRAAEGETHTHKAALSPERARAQTRKSSRSSCRRADILPSLRRAASGLHLPSVYQRKSSSGALPCTRSILDQLCVLFFLSLSLSRFRLYVIIFFSPNSVVNLCKKDCMLLTLCVCTCVCVPYVNADRSKPQ